MQTGTRRRLISSLFMVIASVATGHVAYADEKAIPEEGVRTISLSDALRNAEEGSGLIAAARLGIDEFQQKVAEARAKHYPSGHMDLSMAPVPSQSGKFYDPTVNYDEWGVFTRFKIEAYVPLFTFGKIHYLKQAAELGVDVARAQVQMAKADVRQQVLKAYFGLELARELENLIDEGLGYFEKAKKHVQKMEDDDDVSFDPVDKMKIRVYEAQIQSRVFEARRSKELALAGIRAAMGENPDGFVDVRTSKPKAITPLVELTVETAIQNALVQRVELLALRTGIKARQAEETARFANLFPDLYIAGQFKADACNVCDFNNGDAFVSQTYNGVSGGGLLGLRWDLGIGTRLAQLNQTKAQKAQLQAKLDSAELGVRLEVRKLFREMEDARGMLELRDGAVKAARGWVLAKTDLYENGLTDLRDVMDGLIQFLLAQIDHLGAIYTYNTAVAALERATGMVLVNESAGEVE